MLKLIDATLNRVTMYRLVLYYLLLLWLSAMVFSALGWFSFTPWALLISTVVLIFSSWATNQLFAKVFGAQPNVESLYITALILSLIMTPVAPKDLMGLSVLIWVAIIAMASKYIFAVYKKHLFNPVG